MSNMAYSEPQSAPSVTEFFRAFTSETRLRLLNLFLQTEHDLCVCEMVDALGLPQDRVSKHLKTLKAAGVVSARRKGTWVYYRLNRDRSQLVFDLFDLLEPHLPDALTYDVARLRRRLDLRDGDRCVVGFVSEKELQKLLRRVASSRASAPPGSGHGG